MSCAYLCAASKQETADSVSAQDVVVMWFMI